jgi:hypothetical protein
MTKRIKVSPIVGWLLIALDDDAISNPAGEWNIAWHDIFSTKKSARDFAIDNNWSHPWRAVRGELVVIDAARAQPEKR